MTTTDPGVEVTDEPQKKPGKFRAVKARSKSTSQNGADGATKKAKPAKKPTSGKRENLIDYNSLKRQAAPFLIPAVAVFVLFWGANQFFLASKTKDAKNDAQIYAAQIDPLSVRLSALTALNAPDARAQAEAAVAQAKAGFMSGPLEFEKELQNVRVAVEALGARWIGFATNDGATVSITPTGTTPVTATITMQLPAPTEEAALSVIRTLQSMPRIAITAGFFLPENETYAVALTLYSFALPTPPAITDPAATPSPETTPTTAAPGAPAPA